MILVWSYTKVWYEGDGLHIEGFLECTNDHVTGFCKFCETVRSDYEKINTFF